MPAIRSLVSGVFMSWTLEILYLQRRAQLVSGHIGPMGGWVTRKQWMLAGNLVAYNITQCCLEVILIATRIKSYQTCQTKLTYFSLHFKVESKTKSTFSGWTPMTTVQNLIQTPLNTAPFNPWLIIDILPIHPPRVSAIYYIIWYIPLDTLTHDRTPMYGKQSSIGW